MITVVVVMVVVILMWELISRSMRMKLSRKKILDGDGNMKGDAAADADDGGTVFLMVTLYCPWRSTSCGFHEVENLEVQEAFAWGGRH